MTTKRNIKDLLDKFSHDNITREELDFLYYSINHDLHSDDVKAWLYRIWDEASEKSNKIKSSELFQSITAKISDPSFAINQNTGLKTKKVLLYVTSYAAVLIIGFFISLFIRNTFLQLDTPKDVSFNEIHIPLGSKSKILLSDGTQVWLNAGSTLKYPGRFKENSRDIYLEGEAYFDVTHDENRPFYVNTSELHIKVLGTQFNVKSYPEESFVEATLISGSIEIEARESNHRQRKQLRLVPNQKATFSKSTNQLTLQNIDDPDIQKPMPVGKIEIENQINTEIITSWKDNKLLFSRERFEELAARLERWYDVQIILEDENVKEYRYTGTFEKETLEQALAALKIASDFEYTIDKNTIIIYSKN